MKHCEDLCKELSEELCVQLRNCEELCGTGRGVLHTVCSLTVWGNCEETGGALWSDEGTGELKNIVGM